jgi:hypothetical protein
MDAIRFVNYTENSKLLSAKNYIIVFLGGGQGSVNYFSQHLFREQNYDETLKMNWLKTILKEATKLVRLDV